MRLLVGGCVQARRGKVNQLAGTENHRVAEPEHVGEGGGGGPGGGRTATYVHAHAWRARVPLAGAASPAAVNTATRRMLAKGS